MCLLRGFDEWDCPASLLMSKDLTAQIETNSGYDDACRAASLIKHNLETVYMKQLVIRYSNLALFLTLIFFFFAEFFDFHAEPGELLHMSR